MSGTIIVTGADRNYFLMAATLVHAVRTFCPDVPVLVCDFGLSEAQRRFLEAGEILLDRPAELPAGLHPFFYKAALDLYVRPRAPGALVWMDCDMTVLDPGLAQALAALLERMAAAGAEAAACRETGAASAAEAIGQIPAMAPFGALLRAGGVDPEAAAYVNTGFVACRSPAFLAAWRDLAFAVPVHPLFEQNAFNVLVHRRGGLLELPADEWNLHGPRLEAAVAGPPPAVLADGRRVRIAHATSPQGRHHENLAGDVTFDGLRVPGQLKLIRNPVLRARQQAALAAFLGSAGGRLEALGLAVRANGGAAAPPSHQPSG